jgi:hypothetical protein
LPSLELPAKAIAPPFVNEVKLPAVALFVKMICPGPGVKFCTIPELLVMPVPLMVTVGAWLTSVNGLAPALNTIPFTSVSAAKNTRVILEKANVAMSAVPLGIVAGVQFAAVFQFPEPGLAFQVALPPKAAVAAQNMSTPTPPSALPLDSLGTAARGMVFITSFVRLFRFMAGESNEISSGRDLLQNSRLAIDKVVHDNDVLSKVGRGRVVAGAGGGCFQNSIAGSNSD